MKRQKGFTFLPIIISGLVIVAAIAYFISHKPQIDEAGQDSGVNLVEATIETPQATQESTATATPTPSNTPKPTTTPVPTPKPVSGPPGSGYSKITVHTEVGDFSASVVSIDMTGVRMVTDTTSDDNCSNDCPVLSLADFVSRNGAFAGINGSYFCPSTYPDCQDKKNSFDFPVYNSRLSKWINQDKLFWDNRGLIYQDGGGMHFKKEAKFFGGSLNAGITNYPVLLDGGNVTTGDYSQSDKQQAAGSKGGIGLRGNTVYLVFANVTMNQFAHIFKSLGADYALNLDGGGSSALWYGGYKVGPGRALPNAVVFVR